MRKVVSFLTSVALLSPCVNSEKLNENTIKSKELILETFENNDRSGNPPKTFLLSGDGANSLDDKEPTSPFEEMISTIKEPIILGNLLSPEVAITIDDGAGSSNITAILDTLHHYNVKATFFIVGDCISLHAKERKKALEAGHQICNHTYSHHYFRQTDPQRLEEEILKREDVVVKSLGEEYLHIMKKEYPFFRFPGGCGATNTEHLAVLKKYGYLPLGRSNDRWNGEDLQNGEILLFHFKKQDFTRISACVRKVHEQGKQCKQLTDLLDPADGYTPIGRRNLNKAKNQAKNQLKNPS